MNTTIDLIHRHRSVRKYTSDPLPDADVVAAVRAGQSASTSSAVQSYCLIRVRDQAKRAKLVELTGNQTKVAECGAFFVICGDVRRHRLLVQRSGREYDAHLEAFLLAVIDATLFAQNLVLAFESMGYGICYIGGVRNHIHEIDQLLGLPQGVYPFYGLCVGVAAEAPSARPRLPVPAVLLEERYPDDQTMLGHLADYDTAYREYLRQRGAPEKAWTQVMVDKFARPERVDLAGFYSGKGAVMA
jgi:FMN reductase (NADPH)